MRINQDTVFAPSSAPGRSALSIIRVTGKKAFTTIKKITKNKLKKPKHQKSYVTPIYNINNDLIDKVVLTFYFTPKSYTGEDLVEITTHGNPIIVDVVFDTFVNLGLRLANPGEFTSRAYHNKKIDLIQAESTLSIINAKSKAGVRSSLLGVLGKLSNKLEKTKQRLILLLGELEYELDISDTDNYEKTITKAKQNIQKTILEMEELVETHKNSSILNDGARVVIIGSPNVGKSTLLNSLINNEKAIVTDIPGTTRDTVEALTYFSNFPILLVDTAGIRKTKNKIEAIGIKKTKQEIMSADLIYNIQSSDNSENQKTNEEKTIKIYNKSDLMTKNEIKTIQREKPDCVIISAKNNSGLNQLRRQTEKMLKLKTESKESVFLSSKRQQTALIRAIKHLKNSLKHESLIEIEIIAHNLRLALNEFDWIIGKTTADDILDSVFSNFCVGK